MTQRFWKTKKFKRLQIEWEEKLKLSGFTDIEDDKRRLQQRADNCYRTQERVLIESKLRYYELLGQIAHHEVFKDEVERLVIERRSNGVKIKDICIELKGMGERCYRGTIRRIIRFYEIKWKITR